jgi:hypothetical protein
MKKKIAGLHGTRFGIRTMEARLRSAITLPGRRPDRDEVLLACGDCLAGIDENGADTSCEDRDPQLDDSDSDTNCARKARDKYHWNQIHDQHKLKLIHFESKRTWPNRNSTNAQKIYSACFSRCKPLSLIPFESNSR